MIGSVTTTGTVLDRILTRTAADVAVRKTQTPLAALERRAADRNAPIDLASALRGPDVGVIAEIKRASPSRGEFPVIIDPAIVAKEYLTGGAAALSVLTDEPFFRGSLADLEAAATVAHHHGAPVLRKDFMIDAYQMIEALAYGADVILLIVAALDQPLLESLLREATDLGLSALVEVHTEEEMRRAADSGASIIGINNRDLKTFQVDLAVTERLAPLAPPDTLLVGESGIFAHADVERLQRAGVQAVLVGESLITAPDREAAVQTLRGSAA
jgi:indole-3-glycerol phosphate synthase